MKKHPALITTLSLLVGLFLFIFVVHRTGARELFGRVREIGWSFTWILIVSGIRPAVRAWAWLRCMAAGQGVGHGIEFLAVWRARLIGDAVGNLTAAGPLLAEPARLVFFSGRVSMVAAASALSIELLTYIASCVVLMVAGLTLLLLRFAVNASLRAVSLTALILLLASLAIVVTGLIRRWSLSSLLGNLIEMSGSEHRIIDWIDRQLERLYKIENDIFDFYRQRPRDFLFVCVCETVFHIAGVIEIWLTLRLIGERPTLVTAFIFEAVNRLITMVFSFVPARMGVDEAGTGLLAAALGLGSLPGVAMAVYRKLRVLFWTAAGLMLLGAQLRTKSKHKHLGTSGVPRSHGDTEK